MTKPAAIIVASAIALLLVVAAIPASQPIREDERYALIRGGRFRLGTFDAAGNFIPKEGGGSLPEFGGFSGNVPLPCNINHSDKAYRCLEHRSGRLIKGVLIRGGTFVPDVGSRLMALTDYHPDPKPSWNTPRIWNLPTSWPKRPNSPPPSPHPLEAPTPQPIGPPAGYTYLCYSQRPPVPWVAHIIGKKFELGHLDDAGDFIPEYALPRFALSLPAPQAISPHTLVSREPLYYNLPDQGPQEDVYEYRSGRLLIGILKVDGTFVPDSFSTVLAFADYDPVKSHRRIYNLPGLLTKNR